ncbi:MAG: 50S ribosomal protein L10 [Candidatus Aenigmatarchaeota archaeon]
MVREEKIRLVEELKNLLENYKTICLIDITKLPSKQLQEIRKKIRSEALIKIVKKNLLKKAMEKVEKKNLKEFEGEVPNQPGLILTNLDPFTIYKKISELKSFVFAKEGDVAPEDIWVRAGPTNLLPGPVISEFSKAKIPAGVEGGKIAIKKDVLVAKKGEVISAPLANILRKLNIQPIKVGLNIVSIYSDGAIYRKDVLELINTYPEKIKEGFSKALSLSIGICYPTKENIGFLLGKAFNIAKTLEKLIKT